MMWNLMVIDRFVNSQQRFPPILIIQFFLEGKAWEIREEI